MFHKKAGAQLPWQAQCKNPNAGKPHAGVIMQIIGSHQFLCPCIKTINAGIARNRVVQHTLRYCIGIKGCELVPHAGAMFQPAFPIDAPKHLLHIFLNIRQRMFGQGLRHDLIFAEHAVRNIGR